MEVSVRAVLKRLLRRTPLPVAGSAFCAALQICGPGASWAQGAAEPWESGCLVTGLKADGDGFLSVRRGPGSSHPEIARVRNGDALFFDQRKCQGKWCLAEGGAVSGKATNIHGWFYTAWCEFYP